MGRACERSLELLGVPSLWAALACYGLSVVVWLVGLSRVPVSQAYPLLSLGYVLNIGLAWWLLGEVPNVQRVLGIGSSCLEWWCWSTNRLNDGPAPESRTVRAQSRSCRSPGRPSTRRRSRASSRCCAPAGSPSGPNVKKLEAALSEYCGGRPVRTQTSATASLEHALLRLRHRRRATRSSPRP